MLDAITVLAIAQKYTDDSIEGAGGNIKGKNCEIQSITPITGGNRVTFVWYDNDDVIQTSTLDVMDGVDGQNGQNGTNGVGIYSIAFKETDPSGDNVYTVTLTDGDTYDFVAPKGDKGDTGATGQNGTNGTNGADGVGIASVTFKEVDAQGGNVYTITLTNNQTYDFTAPKGAQGASGANYSTTEQVIGTWTNGKPVYQKVLTGTTKSKPSPTSTVAQGSDQYIDVGARVDEFIDIRGKIDLSQYHMSYVLGEPIAFTDITGQSNMRGITRYTRLIGNTDTTATPNNCISLALYGSNGALDVWDKPYTIIVQYTKVTD